MHVLYPLAVSLTWFFLQIAALFNPKLRLFVQGRKSLAPYLKRERDPEKPLLWMHTASLGEFEQGLPVLEALSRRYPDHQVLVTFFSPSGYEVKKDRMGPALVAYLPMDTRGQVREFLRLARPRIALFVKYEVWPELFRQLEREQVPILMVSAIFRPRQAYFRWYGSLLRKALRRVGHFYVQDPSSAQMLGSIGIGQVTVSGDTRFDRVREILDRGEPLPFMEVFKGDRTCLVAGSTWPEDHECLLPFIEADTSGRHCYVIAPHKIDPKTIAQLERGIGKKTVRYSERAGGGLEEATVLILDTIGLLTRIYRYGEIAYVGGGFATGLHNTLEPAVHGIPVLIGPGYQGFREAEALVEAGGIAVVRGPGEFADRCGNLLEDPEGRDRMGTVNRAYIEANQGATKKIMQGVQTLLG